MTPTLTTPDVAARVASVRERIERAAERAGRDPAAVTLIAVTKTVDAQRVRQAIEAGCTELGENRVQEALAKRAELPDVRRWHLIGHLQTNKAARAAELFDVVHSVDSLRVAEALAARRPDGSSELEVLAEVELTGLPARTGYAAAELREAVDALLRTPRIRLVGLMTLAAPVGDQEAARPTFARLRQLRDQLEAQTGRPLAELSMGMSDDFEAAVSEGATMIRLGRAIFGERPPRRG